jgi:hypothetical protein
MLSHCFLSFSGQSVRPEFPSKIKGLASLVTP